MRLSIVRSIVATTGFCSLLACTPNEGPSVTAPLFATTTIDSTVGTVMTTSLAVDVSQRLHVLYSSGSTLRYATCGSLCSQATSWQQVTVDTTTNSGQSSSLVVDAAGLHTTYMVFNGQGDLRYATCVTTCIQAAQWQVTTIDSSGDTGHDASLAVDGTGHLQVTYIENVSGGRGHLKYASCSTACSTATSWQITVLDSATYLFASPRAFAIDGSGRRQLVYQKSDTLGVAPLYYSECDTGCGNPANWQSSQVDVHPLFDASPVIALDPSGRPRAGYWDMLSGIVLITFASCDTQCTSTAWHILPLQTIENGSSDYLQHSLVVDATGRPHMSFQHGGLSYAGCNSICTLPGSWFEVPIEATLGTQVVGAGSSVAALPIGLFQAGVVYLSAGPASGKLRFAISN
jgi:hypothetical protein